MHGHFSYLGVWTKLQNRECNFDKEVQKKKEKKKTIGGETVTQHGFIFPINCQIKSQLQLCFLLKRIQHWLRHCELKALLFVTKAKLSLVSSVRQKQSHVSLKKLTDVFWFLKVHGGTPPWMAQIYFLSETEYDNTNITGQGIDRRKDPVPFLTTRGTSWNLGVDL